MKMKTRIALSLITASVIATSFCASAQTTDSFGQVRADLTRVLDTLTPEQIRELQNLLDKRLTGDGKSVSNVAYSAFPIDKSIERLPLEFAAQDPQQIYNALVEKFGPKREFESTPQYQERLQSEKDKPLFGDIRANGLFVSEVDHSKDNAVGKAEMVYDADRQVLQVTAWLSLVLSNPSSFGNPNGKQAIRVRNIVQPDINSYSLIFNNSKNFGIKQDKNSTKIKFDVPMGVDEAKEAKSSLKILLLYQLVEPFTQEWKGIEFPQIFKNQAPRPTDRYLNVNVEEIWFYNSETGKIYHKIKPIS